MTDANLNLARLITEELYINVHTKEVLGGAIRGQLSIVQQPIPEPSAALLGGLAFIAGLCRRRR